MHRPRPVALAVAAAWAGAGVARWRAGPSVRERLADWAEREQALGRPVLLLAPAMAAGALLHLSLPFDPPAWLLAIPCGLALLAAFAFRHTDRLALGALLAAGMAIGTAAAALRVERASAPRIERLVPQATVTGRVLRVEPRAGRAPRVLLQVATVDRLGPERRPERLMLVGRTLATLRVGDGVTVRGRLAPLPLPTHPGAYDPSFAGYFDRLGGYVFVNARPAPATLPPPDLWTAAAIAVTAWRTGITERIVERLGPTVGPVAAALVTGQRTAIPEEVNAVFNASGLLHVLSISGLHMALVAGGVFWLVRLLLAAVPFLALRLPVKKVAAVVALGMATFYEIASGAEVATTRSYVMIVVVFVAVLLDRPAVTMRNLMLAALLLLAIMPEAVLSVSFQMSFAATAALVAGIERRWLPRFATDEQPRGMRILARVAEAVAATAVVSVLCELAILPIQLYHFHRVVWFGIVGNVLAFAVVDFLIMPAALLALLLLPFGMGDWVLPILGFGVERMTDIARFVASLPGAVTSVRGFGPAALVACLAGVLWAVTWRTPIALLGAAPYLAGFLLWTMERPPDMRVSGGGELVAVRGPEGRLSVLASSRDDFALRRWLESDGDGRQPNDPSLPRAWRCDPSGCTAALPGGAVLAMPRDLAALAEDCARADLLLLPRFAAPPDCARPRLVLDRAAIGRAHGIAIAWRDGTPAVTTLADRCGTRPWCPDPSTPRFRLPFAPRRAQ